MSAYPGSIDDDATLYVPADSFSPPKTLSTTLAVNALNTDTDIQIVASVGTLGAPTAYGILSIADELIIYTGHSEVGSVYKVTGCTRGAFGTAAVGHLAGVIAKWRYAAEFDLALQAAIKAIETTLGITGAFNFLQDTSGNGIAARTAQGVTTARTITAGRGVDVTNGSGASGDPTIARKAAVNAQTGTSYTIADGDGGKLVTGTNGSAQAYTLPQAGASSLFVSGWFCDIENRGAGALTITPTTSTVDGAATLVLTTDQGCRLFSDGTNYFTQRGFGATTITSYGTSVWPSTGGSVSSGGVHDITSMFDSTEWAENMSGLTIPVTGIYALNVCVALNLNSVTGGLGQAQLTVYDNSGNVLSECDLAPAVLANGTVSLASSKMVSLAGSASIVIKVSILFSTGTVSVVGDSWQTYVSVRKV